MVNANGAEWVIFLWLLLLTAEVGGSSPPLLTIQSPDGDIVDCVLRENQPAFQHPLLKNHKLQEPPTHVPNMFVNEAQMGYNLQVWHQSGRRCPEGSIPIRRVASKHNGTSSSSVISERTKSHEYVIGAMENKPKIYGTEVTMNVWHPVIEGFNEFSLGQIWLTSGSYDDRDLNSIEAGWQVYPDFYNDSQPRLFIFWTTDAYNLTGGYNLRTGGFVQTSKEIMVEGAISQTSILGGDQVDLTIRIWKDTKSKSWWLGIIIGRNVLEPVGYWPASLFTIQTDYAAIVQWGGEITNKNEYGRHTKTQMGSGYFPDSGRGKVAYMRNLKIALTESEFQPLQNLTVGATHPEYYRGEKLNDTCFYYGGPQQLNSKAAHPMLDYTILYFTFVLFLLF